MTFFGIFDNSLNTTYSDYMKEWFRDKKHSITAKVHDQFIRQQILPSLGNIKIADINPTLIIKFVNDLRDKGLADCMVKCIFNIVNCSLNEAVNEQIIPWNAAALLENKPKFKQKRSPSMDHVSKSKTRCYIAFHLALTTGMRQGEILGLRWCDIDLDRGIISVRQTLSHDGKELKSGAKTKTSIRTISIDPKTVHFLQRQHRIILAEKLHSGGT